MFFGSFWDLLAKTNEEWAAVKGQRKTISVSVKHKKRSVGGETQEGTAHTLS